jgi:hypothetical protein
MKNEEHANALPDDGLDRHAAVEADIAFLDAQQRGETTANCVRAAIRAYLASTRDD